MWHHIISPSYPHDQDENTCASLSVPSVCVYMVSGLCVPVRQLSKINHSIRVCVCSCERISTNFHLSHNRISNPINPLRMWRWWRHRPPVTNVCALSGVPGEPSHTHWCSAYILRPGKPLVLSEHIYTIPQMLSILTRPLPALDGTRSFFDQKRGESYNTNRFNWWNIGYMGNQTIIAAPAPCNSFGGTTSPFSHFPQTCLVSGICKLCPQSGSPDTHPNGGSAHAIRMQRLLRPLRRLCAHSTPAKPLPHQILRHRCGGQAN